MALAAVVDVGSNTVRLLVTRSTEAGPATAHTERVRLDLGHEIEECGRISKVKLAAAAKAVRSLCTQARTVGARAVEVVVTAPGRRDVDAARRVVREAFAGITPPLPMGALVVGGSARALRKVVGPHLGPRELAEAERILAAHSPKQIKRRYGVGKRRGRQLLAAALILSEVQRRLFVPLAVTDGGLREGVVLAAVERAAA